MSVICNTLISLFLHNHVLGQCVQKVDIIYLQVNLKTNA